MKSLHLVVPGLLGPWPAPTHFTFPIPETPALECLLARATVTRLPVSGADATLFRLFDVPVSDDQDLPVAAVTRLADGGDAWTDWWLRADPVHLRADLRQVMLADARSLAVSPIEAESLVNECNNTFEEDGWSLTAFHPNRWYLRLTADPELRTHPLQEAIGRDITRLLPAGSQSNHWRTLLTEIQMLFHSAKVNVERETCGLPAINSVWFWGAGALPKTAKRPGQGIYADDPLTRGLALLAGAGVHPVPANTAAWRWAREGETETLVVMETTRFDAVDNDPQGWLDHLKTLERDWFSGCLAMLKSKLLDHLYLYPCNGQVHQLSPRQIRRFWKRSRPVRDYCQS